jgi:hypothetical protein
MATRSLLPRCRSADAGQPVPPYAFPHYGVNQDDKHVLEGERIVLIKRRSQWGDK